MLQHHALPDCLTVRWNSPAPPPDGLPGLLRSSESNYCVAAYYKTSYNRSFWVGGFGCKTPRS